MLLQILQNLCFLLLALIFMLLIFGVIGVFSLLIRVFCYFIFVFMIGTLFTSESFPCWDFTPRGFNEVSSSLSGSFYWTLFVLIVWVFNFVGANLVEVFFRLPFLSSFLVIYNEEDDDACYSLQIIRKYIYIAHSI